MTLSRLLVVALALLTVPTGAHASLLADRLEISMYGRMGLSWTHKGQFIQGRTMNLTGSTLGGRLEEGDYLEPTIKLHILEPSKDASAPYVDFVFTPAMFAKNGLLLGVFSNRFSETLRMEIFQAYVEAGNILVPGLKVWGGARFYRGADVHIADYFFFNNLSGQGGGVQFGPLDLAVIMQTGDGPLYNFNTDADPTTREGRRQRTVFVAQYAQKFEGGHSAHLLAELHALPVARRILPGNTQVLPSDIGWVAGVKGHLDLGNGAFNDLSVRYGNGIANGGFGGGQTWDTFGAADLADGRYSGAMSLEVVDHFLYNIGDAFSLNAYGILHMAAGASDATSDKAMDFAVGARGTVYVHDNIHLIGEATYQGLQFGEADMGTAVKLSIVPTFVPTGGRSVWARPHFRLFYTLALYNEAAVDILQSPYLKAVGETTMGHYLGARVEWWF
jgi:maltoporin